MAIIEFEGIQNARDLGGIPVYGGKTVAPGLFIRCGSLDKPTESDIQKIRGDLHVATIIDVRTGWERAAKLDVEIEGIENLHIPFFDKKIVGIEYEKPVEGTKKVGNDFACDPSDFYQAMANPLTAVFMGKGLKVTFDNALQGRTTLIHCSGGKDRAGVFSLLLLSVLGANREDILEDYLLTNVSREANIKPIYERFLRLTGDEELARKVTDDHKAKPSNLENFYASVDRKFGGMDTFIANQLGISDEDRELLRAACTR